jgi:hypothetical protein
MVTVPEIGEVDVLVAVKALIGIVPDAPKPIAVLLFVQLPPVSTPEALNGPMIVVCGVIISE